MHLLYRQHFNAVDKFNRLATGPRDIADVWRTKNVWARLFAATLSMVEVNAYLAFTQHCGAVAQKMTRHEWRLSLSSALILNKYLVQRSVIPRSPALATRGEKTHMTLVPLKKQLHCQHCTKRTAFACACGDAVCSPNTGRPCFATHIVEAQQGKLSSRRRQRSRLAEKDEVEDAGTGAHTKRRRATRTPSTSQFVNSVGQSGRVRRCLEDSLL